MLEEALRNSEDKLRELSRRLKDSGGAAPIRRHGG